MKLIEKTDHYYVVVKVGGQTLKKLFNFDPEDKSSKRIAKQAARYWLETRSALTAKAETGGIPNIDESISYISGKHYLYLRIRKNRRIIKSVSVGRLLDGSKESVAAKRQTERYSETVAALREMVAKL